ncbi:hypothetical protein L6164_035827 [Bauhinia variegata]|uniref:Uncharacterized protein n=1 Tax=Bauhinia variegata TaxID=167791 RepID=A0ACB9KF78_BAUVA|nr:hypothetical protein L6164_035827 [Bauhinia variegata]
MFCLRNPSKTRVLLLLCLLITLSVARAQQGPTYDANVCANTSTYAPNSTYQTNLNQLLSSLSSNASQSDGYYNATAGQNNHGSTVYGAFLCRGDVTTDTCRDCVSNATSQVLQRCPNETNAVIWYDECLLQYSNESFFSTVQAIPMVLMLSTANITEQSPFTQLLGDTLNALADETANGGGGKKFATKEANFTSFQTLYTLGQCTPDLSSEDCNRCLQIIIAMLNSCCSGRTGARSLTPSCYIRFEMYLFYHVAASAPAPTPELTSTGMECAVYSLLS